MPTITKLFGRHTPFRELQAHMRVVDECAGHLPALINALLDGDADRLKDEAKLIFALEDQADTLKHACRIHLPRRLFLPVDRRDLLEGLMYQDTIADRCEDIAGIFLQRNMTVPMAMRDGLKALTEQVVRVVAMTTEVIELIDELLEVGFRGRLVKRVEVLVDSINSAEDLADRIERELSRVLFGLEQELDPISVILWYRILEWIGDVADYAEKVGNNFRLIIAR
jgi:predicted phosphate transport protein (TIGR00153 family)